MPLRGAASGSERRWTSARAIRLHLLAVTAVPLCLFAGWWQATRALSGNTLSYVYAIEWPGFAILAIWGWWALLHMPDDTRPERPAGYVAATPAGAASGGAVATPAGTVGAPLGRPVRRLVWDPAEETADLRAYNGRLAHLAATGQGQRSWRRRRA